MYIYFGIVFGYSALLFTVFPESTTPRTCTNISTAGGREPVS